MIIVLFLPLLLILILSDRKIFPVSLKIRTDLLFLILFLIMGLRVGFGRDYDMYQEIYQLPEGTFEYPGFEPIWLYVNEGFKILGFKSRMFFFVTSGMIIGGVLWALKLYGVNLLLASTVFILSGIYFETANTVRQCMAQVMIFLVLPMMKTGRNYSALGLCMASVLFHYSAVIALFLLIITRFTYPKWFLFGLVMLCCLTGNYIIDIVTYRIVPALAVMNKYQYDVYDFSDGVSSGTLKYVYLSLSLLLISYRDRIAKLSALYGNQAVNLFTSGVCIYCVFYTFQPARRLFAYGFMFIMVAFPLLLRSQRKLPANLIGWFYAIVFLLFQTKLSMGTQYDYDLNFL